MRFLVIRHIDFIKLISEVKNDKKRIVSLIKNASNSEINALSELIYNILKGHIPCSPYRKRMIKNHVSDMRIIADKKGNIHNRRKKIVQKGGLLLPTLIPLALTALSALMKKQ